MSSVKAYTPVHMLFPLDNSSLNQVLWLYRVLHQVTSGFVDSSRVEFKYFNFEGVKIILISV